MNWIWISPFQTKSDYIWTIELIYSWSVHWQSIQCLAIQSPKIKITCCICFQLNCVPVWPKHLLSCWHLHLGSSFFTFPVTTYCLSDETKPVSSCNVFARGCMLHSWCPSIWTFTDPVTFSTTVRTRAWPQSPWVGRCSTTGSTILTSLSGPATFLFIYFANHSQAHDGLLSISCQAVGRKPMGHPCYEWLGIFKGLKPPS